MKIEWLLYFIDVFSYSKEMFGCISIISCIFLGVSIATLIIIKIHQVEGWEKDIQNISICKKFCRWFLLSFAISSFFATFIPSQKTMYAMSFAHYSKDSTIPQKVLQAIEVKLDDIIKDAKK